jgi:hypothetical protein
MGKTHVPKRGLEENDREKCVEEQHSLIDFGLKGGLNPCVTPGETWAQIERNEGSTRPVKFLER